MTLKQLQERYDELLLSQPSMPKQGASYLEYDEAMADHNESMASLLTEFVEAWRKVAR